MNELLAWALENEQKVFGTNLRDYAQQETYLALECIICAAEVAADEPCDPGRQRAILRRKARNLFIDALRRRRGTRVETGGRRTFANTEVLVEQIPDRTPPKPRPGTRPPEPEPEPYAFLEGEPIDVAAVRRALRDALTEEDFRLFTMVVEKTAWEAIGQALGLASPAARKRWERARPRAARVIAEVTGLEEYYVRGLLGERRSPRSYRRDRHGA